MNMPADSSPGFFIVFFSAQSHPSFSAKALHLGRLKPIHYGLRTVSVPIVTASLSGPKAEAA